MYWNGIVFFLTFQRVLQRNVNAHAKITNFLQDETCGERNGLRLYNDILNMLQLLDNVKSQQSIQQFKTYLELHQHFFNDSVGLTLELMDAACEIMNVLNEWVETWSL